MSPQGPGSGRYEIESTLGEGGMGVVYRVRDGATGAVVALKRLAVPNESMRPLVTALFEREFHTLRELSHPAVIRVFDYGVDGDGPYYTMELLEGTDLRSRENVGTDELCEVLYGVASALSLLHARRLVHRDVTTANIRLLGTGRAKLIDFGALTPMGSTDRVVGTPSYIAPEAALLQPLDGRADLYSLGVVAYRALTGRYPYRARGMRDLRAAWRVAPPPPVELSPHVSSPLSELTMSLIALEPHLRPRDAAEVMDRLAVIGSVPGIDAPEASRAHFVTPTLVERAPALNSIRALVGEALGGRGGSLVFAGPSGVGRSRTIDAAALEAQLLGATVVRLRRDLPGDFGAIEALLDELRASSGPIPAEPAPRIERRSNRSSWPGSLAGGRHGIIDALCRSLALLSQQSSLVVVADDLHLLDEPSAAVLASLFRNGSRSSIALIGSLLDPPPSEPAIGLRVLLERSKIQPLEPLDESGTRSLVRSLFGAVPGVDALAGKLHRLCRGFPRETLAIAEHLLDRGIVSYAAGAFSIPESVDADELPQNLSAALESRVKKLPRLALVLAQTYALTGFSGLSFEGYRQLSPEAAPEHVFRALDELVAADVLGLKGAEYVLRHDAWRTALMNLFSGEEERAERHRRIAVLLGSGEDQLAQAYHSMRAGDGDAIASVARIIAELTGEEAGIFATTRLTADELGWLLSSVMHELETRLPFDMRTIANLRRYLMALGVFFDARWFFEAIDWAEESLIHDSGAWIWRSLDPSLGALPRTLEALNRAHAAYEASPEEHVHAPLEAIRHVVQYVAAAIVVGARTANGDLRRRLPALLEPFVPLSTVVAAMKENSESAAESTYGHFEVAADRLELVIEALEAPDAAAVEHAEEIRSACIYAVGAYRARLGVQAASTWLDRIAEHPRHVSNVQRTRGLLALHRGDWDDARAEHEAAEQTDLEHPSPQMFGRAGLIGEIEVYARALDLSAIKRLTVAIKPHAERFEGWRPHLDYAQGEYERLRGNLLPALEAFDRATSSTLPKQTGEHPDAGWYAAEAGALETLLELGRLEECRARALHSLRFGDGTAPGARYDGVKRALALCEARRGEFDAATEILDAMIAHRKRIGSSGLGLGLLFEARTLIEIWRNDRAAAAYYLALAAGQLAPRAGSGFARRVDFLTRRLAEEDRLRSRISPLGTESGEDDTGRAVSQALSGCPDARTRASEGLAILCKTANAAEGHLYLLTAAGIDLVTSTWASAPPTGLHHYLAARMKLELAGGDTELITMITLAEGLDAATFFPTFKPATDAARRFHPIWIRADVGGQSSLVGVAALGFDESTEPDQRVLAAASAFGDFLHRAGDTVLTHDEAPTRVDAG